MSETVNRLSLLLVSLKPMLILETILISPCVVGRDVIGATVGLLVGFNDGVLDGLWDGLVVGGRVEGDIDGRSEGEAVVWVEDGLSDDCDGTKDGLCESSTDGSAEAIICGANDGDSLELVGVGASVLESAPTIIQNLEVLLVLQPKGSILDCCIH